MNTLTKISVVALSAVAIPLAAYAAANGPETINLKEQFNVEGKKAAVLFPHHQHQSKLSCDKCHKDAKGGGELVVEFVKKTGSSNDFHKKFCWPCHKEMKVKKGKSCTTCHKKTK